MGARQLLAAVPVGKLRLDLVANPVTTGAWVAVGTVPAGCTAIAVAYSGDAILKLAKVVSGVTTELPLYLAPGMLMEKLIPLELARGWTLSVECEDQNVASGELVINFFG